MSSDKGKKTHIKICFKERRPMKKRAYEKHWAKKFKYTIDTVVKVPLDRKYFNGKFISVPVKRLRNEEEIAHLVDELLPDGEYFAQGLTRRKTPTHVGYTKVLFRAFKETDAKGKSHVNIWDTRRLSHYWFWKNRYRNRVAS